MTSRLLRICFIMALASQAASCRLERSQAKATRQPGPCPNGSADVVLPNSVDAKHAPIKLQLPEGSFQSREFGDSTHTGQGWLESTGLVVSYRLHAEPLPMREIASGDRQVVDCTERIGGRVATIRMLYSESTTAPGQYVVAQWLLDSGETLVVTATHPRSSRRDQLLAIVRSVVFRDSAGNV